VRIIGGTAKGRRLTGPNKNDLAIRPTSERVREALFNIIGEKIKGMAMLDLFAGTGVVGIEALSRGAGQVIFVDNSNYSMDITGKNLRSCFRQPKARTFKLDVTSIAGIQWLRKRLPMELQFDLVFMDPPYGKSLARQSLILLESSGLLARKGKIIVEEKSNQVLPESVNHLDLFDKRSYGETGIWIYQRTGTS
jgi:16S rRNA (guanine966-N2)-methyltransferase